ncbi:non-ribosomal peptide synthetase [Bradyrhizobium sp. CCBAU 051011]|uniref:non-ribosomal peptide synthetase n=1 Tax=Bradyrhizobium sp. CCBAU 051011 TaxID=858422 RepID=UPI0013740E3B|nr:non-ribosomal peptide synthetase [Bradyrhizobium sp. CCBAU 051011]QHO77852.1 non-ribosomal peptide synthetase [Bradyrhizobium sp. CCBAU 051011]
MSGATSKFELSDARYALLDSLLPDHQRPVRQAWWRVPHAEGTATPLSFAQERFWFLDRLQAGNPAYHIPCVIPLRGRIVVAALRDSLSDVVARHEALRTIFIVEGGRPVQRVQPASAVPLSVLECEGADATARRAAAVRIAGIEVVKPFDLAAGPMLRATLLRIDDGEHWLVVTIHHIVCDAWSLQRFLHELTACYEAHCRGRAADLPVLPLQYGDYARWQREWLTGEPEARLLAYWRTRLERAPAVLELPIDRPRPPLPSFRGALHSFVIPRAPSDALRELGRGAQATMFIVMLAVFKSLLHRYTGQRDLVVGTPVANRNRSELEGLIGLFLNTLVLRTEITLNITFRELLARVRTITLEAYEHQDLPFEKLVEDLQPNRTLNVNPLFQVFFVMETAQAAAPAADGAAISTGTAKFDLSLHLTDTAGEIVGCWEYACDLFEASTIARLTGHLQTLLRGIAANPDARLADLPLLSADEVQQRTAWNATVLEYPAELCAHQLVEAQVRATPHDTALICGDENLSYLELNSRANSLAHHLRAIGVGPESPVGICLERSVDMIVALLAVLKAGGPYVPLDPTYPAERLAYMLSNAQAPVVITQQQLTCVLPANYAGNVVRIDAKGVLDRLPEQDPACITRPDHLAYIIYTSGSTGRPKGVGMSHRSLTNLTVWQNGINPLARGGRTVQYNSFSFDVSVLEVLSTLSTAGTLVLASERIRRDAAALADLLAAEHIGRLFMPYTALAQLAEHAAARTDLALGLRQVISTGEPLQINTHIIRFFTGLPGCQLHNEYGPTETHFVTEHVLDENPRLWPTMPPVGRPIANATVHILSATLEPVPVGVVGDLYAGGLSLARAYVGDPGMTAARFIPDPFSGIPGARLYQTGDLARFRSDGVIELLGRGDHQVKVRGFRIELGEIEVALARHPDVQTAVVSARGTDARNRHLVAYVVPIPGAAPSTIELRRMLLEVLPEYMVPSRFVMMTSLPLGGTGKIDRYRLPDPASLSNADDEHQLVPRNRLEEELSRLWCDLLLCNKIGVHDNFFALGGHSLTAVQLATRIRDSFGVNLPVQRIFEAPTLAELSVVILQMQAAEADPDELARWLDEIQAEEMS